MEQAWNWIRGAFAALGGILGWVLGAMNGVMYALIAFVVIDYITGVIAAAVQKRLNSTVGFKGIAKKLGIFILVALGHIIDAQILGDGDALRTAVIFFYLSNEGLSIIENAVAIGLPVPEALKNALAHLDKENKNHDEIIWN